MPSANMFSYPRQDVVAGVVVFLVALPLCLGIALACGVPPISGLVAGAVGGLLVPWLSRSPLSVTGPAAGLTAIVIAEIAALGSLELFLTATLLSGGLQILLGVLRTGRLASLVPSSVIKGMLAAIGITIIWKQLPAAFGATGDFRDIGLQFHLGATLLTALSLLVLFGWRHTPLSKMKLVSPALVVVVLTSVLGLLFGEHPSLALASSQLVDLPLGGVLALVAALPRPDLAGIGNPAVWLAAATIAVVASIETLLSLQAVDRLDPLRRTSPLDRELMAQGAANAVSGFLGGLPVTAVIVRGGANVAAGGRERLSALVHGVLLVLAVVFAGALLTRIPLAALAAVLALDLLKGVIKEVIAGFLEDAPRRNILVTVAGIDLSMASAGGGH